MESSANIAGNAAGTVADKRTDDVGESAPQHKKADLGPEETTEGELEEEKENQEAERAEGRSLEDHESKTSETTEVEVKDVNDDEMWETEDEGSCETGDDSLPVASEIEEIIRSMNKENNKYDWTSIGIRAGITTILYPSQMTQILMQVGYEPFPPRRSVTLLGRPCLLLPSTGTYIRYIYHVDGVKGVFRGLFPRLAHQMLFTYVFDSARCFLRTRHARSVVRKATARDESMDISELERGLDESENSECGAPGFFDHFREVIHDLGSRVVAIVVSYPVHVVVVRTIAHFVGREHSIRRGIFGEIGAIYRDFGFFGFYRGIVPKILGEVCQALVVGTLSYFVANQAPGIEVRSLLNLSFSILVSAWTYQFNVVSTTMAVNGSCLQVGQPPIQPHYDNWIQCWRELSKLKLLNRGSSIICRYYTGPTTVINGLREPTSLHFGPNHLALRLTSPIVPGALNSSKILLSFGLLACHKFYYGSLPFYHVPEMGQSNEV